MRISIIQIIILILFVLLIFGDLNNTKKRIKHLFNYAKKKFKENRKKGI